jgi:TolA-binding protein
MSAQKFVELLSSRQLVSPEIIEELRRQLSTASSRLTPEMLAKLLVDGSHMTRFQASQLVSQSKLPGEVPAGGQVAAVPMRPTGDEQELDFAPRAAEPSAPLKATVRLDGEGSPRGAATAAPTRAAGAQRRSPAASDTSPASRPTKAGGSRAAGSPPPKPVTIPWQPQRRANDWDSFRILGMLAILGLLTIPLVFLGYWFWRGSAEERVQRAEAAYEAGDYEAAMSRYTDFLKRFPTDPRASRAKVRVGLSEIRLAHDRRRSPLEVSRLAESRLKPLADEDGLPEQRGDVAGLLMSVAERFNQQASAASTVDDKTELMRGLQQHLDLLSDARLFGATERRQNQNRLERIEEERQRIELEVTVESALLETLEEMAGRLEKQEIEAAYASRLSLLRRFPRLEREPRLETIMTRATDQLRLAVREMTSLPQPSETIPQDQTLARPLVSYQPPPTQPTSRSRRLYVPVDRGVYGLDATTGRVLWHRLLPAPSGIGLTVMTMSDGGDDVLVLTTSLGRLWRLEGQSGEISWELNVDRPLCEPWIDGQELLLATQAGEVLCIDLPSGRTKWGTRLPQPLQTSPGGGDQHEMCYVLGDHSNVYLLDRASGRCLQVHYLGHPRHSARTRPLYVARHMIAAINDGSQTSSLYVLPVAESDAGQLRLLDAPAALQMQGQVVVPIERAGLRLAVLTDLGEINILELDVTGSGARLTRLGQVVANRTSPRLGWPLVDGNQLWLAADRLGSYQLQVSQQRVAQQWVQHDGDRFLGPPQRIGDYLIHLRNRRGTQGIRVSGVDPASGQAVWQTDVGVPIQLLAGPTDWTQPPASGRWVTMTNQAGWLAETSPSPETAPAVVDSELSGNLARPNFSLPLSLEDGRQVSVNLDTGMELAVVDPSTDTTSATRIVPLRFGQGAIQGEPASLGNRLVTLLDNGQVAMISPDSGQIVGTPYQPPLAVDNSPSWISATADSQRQVVWVARSDRQLFRLVAEASGLRNAGQRTLEAPMAGRMVVVEESLVGVSARGAQVAVEWLASDTLENQQRLRLGSLPVWGPYVWSENQVALATPSEGLIGVTQGQQLWKLELGDGVPVGPPTVIPDGSQDRLLVLSDGQLLRIGSAGALVGRGEVPHRLSSPPVIAADGRRLWLGSQAGLVLWSDLPTAGQGVE